MLIVRGSFVAGFDNPHSVKSMPGAVHPISPKVTGGRRNRLNAFQCGGKPSRISILRPIIPPTAEQTILNCPAFEF
jgi:hypothetical protein